MQLSKNNIKEIALLKLKKHRDEKYLFVAEGRKIVYELLSNNFDIEMLVCTDKFLNENKIIIEKYNHTLFIVSESDYEKISNHKNPGDEILAVCKKLSTYLKVNNFTNSLNLVLDDIQDPGNLGTIIRLADWFGIKHIICSVNTADCYNPKVIQASMGAFMRVNLHYVDLNKFLLQIKDELKSLPIYGTFLEGENIYKSELSENGLIIMGNEGKGISENIAKYINKSLFIPNFPINSSTSESLNVSTATAIVCSEFRRRAL